MSKNPAFARVAIDGPNYIDSYNLPQQNASEVSSVPIQKASMMLQATRKDKGIGVMNQISHGYMFESPNQNQNDRGPSLFEEAKLESKY